MNVQINQLVKSLLQKDDISQCSLQELQQFADKNPYFGAAQLLLTKKMQTEAPAQYDEQLQKTFLFFNNPLWVEQMLNGTGKAKVIPAEKKYEPVPAPVEEIVTQDEMTTEPLTKDTVIVSQPDVNIEPELPVVATEPAVQDPTMDNPALANETAEAFAEPRQSSSAEAEIPVEAPVAVIPGKKIDTPATMNAPEKDELIFEPFHTVDYFASQGIKFKEEEKPTDKFGKQLKSFTDWLKSMKKLPVTEIAKVVESNSPAQAEKKVEQLAEHSLAEREVLTETMAEVWEKQGNKAKAIDIYQKLSLLDPSKSPYFAAKIEALNKQT
jgi:hypothetical protein